MSTLVKPADRAQERAELRALGSERPIRLFQRDSQRIKRIFDIVLAILLGVPALPLGLLIALVIRLESRGPALFAHTRIGRGNRPFTLWKFRSMAADADPVLWKHLEKNPKRLKEWLLTHKLKDDPRVTRIGRFLRKRSLDELPQLWNVLRGDMSMLGPRPIVEAEVAKYGEAFSLYVKVRPGLTGLWQVSGRNDTSYGKRVELDSGYIRNWTPGMDLRLLLQTVRVVLGGRGAY